MRLWAMAWRNVWRNRRRTLVPMGSEISGIAFDPVIYPEVFPDHMVAIGVVVVITTLLAGVLPALRAGRVVPVEAVRLG